MKTITLLSLALAMSTGAASAQQRTFYNSNGSVAGKSFTNSSGAATNYDSSGHVVGRAYTSGNQTKIYDAGGHHVGTFTTR